MKEEIRIKSKIKRFKRIFIVVFFLINPLIVFSQNKINFEKVAFDYFVDSLLNQSSLISTKVLFDGSIKLKYTAFHKPFGCFDDKEMFIALKIKSQKKVLDNKTELTWIKSIQTKKLVFNKKQKLQKKKYIMSIFSSSPYNSKNYVLIRLDRLSDNIDYFIEIDQTGKVTNWCQTGRL